MRISARKSGEIVLGMTELEAVAFQEVIQKTQSASETQPKTFTRSQKAVLKDAYKNLNDLDKAIDASEKRHADSDGEDMQDSGDSEVSATA
jgi:hypothetical protein